MTLRATILMPAHNEAGVIGPVLARLAPAVAAGQLRLVVIANACTDRTAEVACAACPDAIVIDTPVPGKTHALNLGLDQAAALLPVICMDADLIVTSEMLFALIAPLDRALAAVGRMEVDAQNASPLVRAYQRAWATNPYFARGKFGGLFALSPAAVARVFPLPAITGDDEFIRRSFAAQQVAFVPACRFTAQSPRSLRALVATRRRALRGARQVAALGLANPDTSSARIMLTHAMPSLRRLADLSVFAAVMAATRIALRFETQSQTHWERDLTSRTGEATL